MDEIVTILRDVARDRGRSLIRQLDPEAIIEYTTLPVAVIRAKHQRKIGSLRAVTKDGPEHGGKQITAQIRRHVPSRLVLGNGSEFWSFDPLEQLIVRSAIVIRQTCRCSNGRRVFLHLLQNAQESFTKRMFLLILVDVRQHVRGV